MFFRDLARIPWLLALVGHALAGAAWFWLMPGGFPWTHARFLANRGLPLVVIGVSMLGLYAGYTKKARWLRASLFSLAMLWAVAAGTSWGLFPLSARILAPAALLVAALLWLATRLPAARPAGKSRLAGGLIAVGAVAGLLFPFAQRANLAVTRPLGGSVNVERGLPVMGIPRIEAMSKRWRCDPREGSVMGMRNRYVVSIEPLLTFISRSPDRCWTLFAPQASRQGPGRTLVRWGREESAMEARYADDGDSSLWLRAATEDALEIEAVSRLAAPIYSHLNTFFQLSVTGHEALSIVFSPCPDTPVDVLPMEYPVGRPSRFAYLDVADVLHVVEASSGEKGPFRELAAGPLRRGQPLQITLLDEGRAFAEIILEDWTAQVSTALSPTAGWGVPENAIEFSLDGSSRRAGAGIFVTLASTSVGRGFDSVGHGPGTYRSRAKVRFLPR